MQKYCYLAFAKVENRRLKYIETHQCILRVELYQNLCDGVAPDDQEPERPGVGTRIILPVSFSGSQRDMHRRYQDAMAIIRKYGKPDLILQKSQLDCRESDTDFIEQECTKD